MTSLNHSGKRSVTFSVLMSVYKGDDASHLKSALNSIFESQTRKPDQIVIVVDGPVSVELINVIEGFRVCHDLITEVVWCESNNGLGIALKKGTEYCTCDYILRMDADDLSVPDRFELQAEYAEQHPDIDAFGGYIEEFKRAPGDLDSSRKVPLDELGIRSMLKMRNPMNHVTMCIKKSSLKRVGGYEDVPYCEDYYLWAKMLANECRLENMPFVLVNVRVGNGFTERRGAKKQVFSWSIIQRFLLANRMTSRTKSWIALISIRLFVYMPTWMKKMLYGTALRSKKA